MYDTLLYGNGLSLALQNQLYSLFQGDEFREYIFVEKFILDFFSLPNHKRIAKDFMRTFNKDTKGFENQHTQVKSLISRNINDIVKVGFERWISKVLFSDDYTEKELSEMKPYLYSLYNYWYGFLSNRFLKDNRVYTIFNEVSTIVKSKISGDIYTTNFDMLLDLWINPQHIHGRFTIPYNSFADIIAFSYNNGENFEYKYLFGGNGLEKLNRLDMIWKRQFTGYDLDFFYQNNGSYNLGNILVYGLSFAQSYILSENLLERYPEHKDTYICRCIDGHLVMRLEALLASKCIKSITICFYSDEDLKHYEWLFRKTVLGNVIEYKKALDVFDI